MKTKLSGQSPSPIPVTFQMDSPSFPIELEVKSKTRLIESTGVWFVPFDRWVSGFTP